MPDTTIVTTLWHERGPMRQTLCGHALGEFDGVTHRDDLAFPLDAHGWIRGHGPCADCLSLLPEPTPGVRGLDFDTYEDDGRVVFTSRVWPWVIADGTSSRYQTVTLNAHEDDRELTPKEARRYAAAILQAADIAEGKEN